MDDEESTDQYYYALVTIVALILAPTIIIAYLIAIFQPAWMKNVIQYFKAYTNPKKKSDNGGATNEKNRKTAHDDMNNKSRVVKMKQKREKIVPHVNQFQSSVQELHTPDENSTNIVELAPQPREESNKKNVRNRKMTSKNQQEDDFEIETLVGQNPEDEPFLWVTHTGNNKRKHRKKRKEPPHLQTSAIRENDPSQTRSVSSSDSERTSQAVMPRKIPYHKEKNSYHFTLDEAGGITEFPFGNAEFPENAVSEKTQFRFVTLDTKPSGDENITLVTPTIHCSKYIGYDSVDFKLPVKFEMKPLNNRGKDVEVQVTQSFTDLRWDTVENCRISKENDIISFKLKQFAGFRVVSRNPEIREKCSIYHTVFVKRPTGISDPSQHNFSVLVHSNNKKARKSRENTLRSGEAVVISEPQTLSIRPPCTVTVSLTGDEMVSVPSEHEFHIDKPDEYFIKIFNIQLKKKDSDVDIHPLQYVDLTYFAWSGCETRHHRIPFQWSVPFESVHSRMGSVSGSVYSAYGTKSIAVQNNYYPSNHDDRQSGHPSHVAREQSSPATFMRVQPEGNMPTRNLEHQSFSSPTFHTENRSSTPVADDLLPDSFIFTSTGLDEQVRFSLSQ